MKNILTRSFTAKSFSAAIKTTFDGVKARRENIHELMLIAAGRITDENLRDTDWLNQIAAAFEDTAGLSVDKFALWVKTSILADVTDENGIVTVIPALEWSDKKKSFSFARKGLTPRLVSPLKWYEVGAKPNVAQTYNCIGSLESFIKKATDELKKGNLSADEAAMLSAIVGIKAQYAPTTVKPTLSMGTAPRVSDGSDIAEVC